MAGPEFQDFIQWGFYSLIAFCAVYGVNKLTKIEHRLEDALVSNAKLQERDNQQARDIDRLDLRIQRLEQK